ncbi:Hypothetical predicted protein [Paramuricea clavata]|uniref:Uncharacterized protein n=1 Tax=Paramuricea clavata TaxID=317549 RepID=A0A7D9ECS5_PARCT|nr:Hypothetical predicted protein [Paramuricea clavata]
MDSEESISKTLRDAGVTENTITTLKDEELFQERDLELASIDLLRGIGLKGGQILAIKTAFEFPTNLEKQPEPSKAKHYGAPAIQVSPERKKELAKPSFHVSPYVDKKKKDWI